jgi:hypothetical protein
MKDNGVCGTDYFCDANRIDAVYSTYATGKEMDLSLFNVINNSVCDDYKNIHQRNIYKCRLKSKSTNLETNTPVSSASIACHGHSNPRLPGEACPSWSTIGNAISEESELQQMVQSYSNELTNSNKIKEIWDTVKPQQ